MPRLTDEQVQAAITSVDQREPLQQAEICGPFAVFRINALDSQEDAGAVTTGDREEIPETLRLDDDRPAEAFPELNDFITTSDDDIVTDNYSQPATEVMPHPEISGGQCPNSEQIPLAPLFQSVISEHFPSPAEQANRSQYTDETSPDQTNADCSLSIRSDLFFRPTFLTFQVKHLLDHYSRNVLRIFSILDNKNTPWSSFHLPRALQCCSELEVVGKSTPARSALLHAILSVSTYNLQCRHASENQDAVARKWAELGMKYRMEALQFLKTSAGNPLVATTNAEYKELLAAMLSMVTVDVVSGDTRTCGTHLNGCESLIKARRDDGRGSAKTKALHRIFYYLQVMQDATELTCNAFRPANNHAGCSISDFNDAEYLDLYEAPIDEKLDSASYELIYGLPQSLLVLLHKVCNLLQNINSSENAAIAPSLIQACDQLEDEILDWPVEEATARLKTTRLDEPNSLIIQHHVRAFHNAITIFFCRNIRLMNRRYLQGYVKNVISNLVEIEKIKEREMINAGPLLWPAFVAGEQALDHATREQFVHWFNVIEKHGVGTAKTTRASLEDIWQHSSHNHPQAPVGILHTQLMLT